MNQEITLAAHSRIDRIETLIMNASIAATTPCDTLEEVDYGYAQTVANLITAKNSIEALIKDVTIKYNITVEESE